MRKLDGQLRPQSRSLSPKSLRNLLQGVEARLPNLTLIPANSARINISLISNHLLTSPLRFNSLCNRTSHIFLNPRALPRLQTTLPTAPLTFRKHFTPYIKLVQMHLKISVYNIFAFSRSCDTKIRIERGGFTGDKS